MVHSIDASPDSAFTGPNVTDGDWGTEAESAAALDEALDAAGLWRVHKEVRGTLAHPRPSQIDKGMRIDRVLVPTARLIELGWQHGIVGIEIKKSGVKIGPPIAQAMDYSRTIWTLPGGFSVWLDWVFVWPMRGLFGPIESVCAQHRIGAASSTQWTPLHLKSGGNILRINRDGSVQIGEGNNGRGAGSR